MQQEIDELIQPVGLRLAALLSSTLPVGVHIVGDLPLHIENRVALVEDDLGHGAASAGAKHHHGHGDVVALVDLVVAGNETVEGRVLFHRPQIRGQQQRQMAHGLFFRAFGIHIGPERRLGNVQRDHIHGVIAFCENIGHQIVEGVLRKDSLPVRSHGFTSCPQASIDQK